MLPKLVCLTVLLHVLHAPFLVGQRPVVPPSAGTFDTVVAQHLTARYQLYLPPGYRADSRRWPLVLFLHGAGERGNDLSVVTHTGLPKLAATRPFPFVLVAPQVPDGEIWSSSVLAALIDRLITELAIDTNRIYLTGLSMGGYGAWDLATTYPERFAAVVSISGGGNPVPACRLRNVPVWLVHGRKDDVIPVQSSQLLAQRLEACGGRVRLTVYPDAGHDAWSRTFADPGFLKWLLAQRRTPTGP
jgi:predicted peptidase